MRDLSPLGRIDYEFLEWFHADSKILIKHKKDIVFLREYFGGFLFAYCGFSLLLLTY
jgi:hypothetical protein